MGILNKLFSRKRDDELDFDRFAEQEMGPKEAKEDLELGEKLPGLEEKSPFPEEPAHLEKPAFTSERAFSSPTGGDKDLELINSKLDTLKAMLSSLEQRMANLERAAGVEQKQKLW